MNIAIIGGGFCGTTLAARLLKDKSDSTFEITLIEKRHDIGKGLAYSTNKTFHLLNVKAKYMGAFPEKPDHFEEWLHRKSIPLSSSEYMPRKLYGVYLNELLEEAMLSISDKRKFSIVREEAIDVDIINGKVYIICDSGRIVEADRIVIAIGNIPPSPIKFDIPNEMYCDNPWECNALEKIQKDKIVLMIGTGLTMVDLCSTLVHNKHQGKIIAVSTHGYTPAAHQNYEPFSELESSLEYKKGLTALFHSIKLSLRSAKLAGKNWRYLIDSLRPQVQSIWSEFSSEDKKSFLKNLARIWNISRHRIPPEYEVMINQLKDSDKLFVKKGRIKNLIKSDNAIEVTFKPRGISKTENFNVDFIVNCTGPQINYAKTKEPIINNLLKKNLIEAGDLGLGLNANEGGVIITKGKPSSLFFTVGPSLIGKLYETTAVPELREQVKKIAESILQHISIPQLMKT